METFSALLALCAENSPVPGEFPAQRPVTRSFDVFFDLHLYKRLSKKPWGWWFETLLAYHCLATKHILAKCTQCISANNQVGQWKVHRWTVNSPHKCPVTRKMLPLDDVSLAAITETVILVPYLKVKSLHNSTENRVSVDIYCAVPDLQLSCSMMTSSNGNICRITGPLWGHPVDSPHKGRWSGALMFSFICASLDFTSHRWFPLT